MLSFEPCTISCCGPFTILRHDGLALYITTEGSCRWRMEVECGGSDALICGREACYGCKIDMTQASHQGVIILLSLDLKISHQGVNILTIGGLANPRISRQFQLVVANL